MYIYNIIYTYIYICTYYVYIYIHMCIILYNNTHVYVCNVCIYIYVYIYITGTLRGIGATQTGTDLEQLWSFSSRSREAFPLESLEVCSGSLLLCSSGLKPPKLSIHRS